MILSYQKIQCGTKSYNSPFHKIHSLPVVGREGVANCAVRVSLSSSNAETVQKQQTNTSYMHELTCMEPHLLIGRKTTKNIARVLRTG